MKHYILIYIATLVVMLALDLTWIGGVMREFYKSHIPNMELSVVPAVLFYLLYAVGVVVFVNGDANSAQHTLVYGALLGLVAYGAYDLTNLATLKDWSLSVVLIDMAWGTAVTAASATLGMWLTGWLEKALA